MTSPSTASAFGNPLGKEASTLKRSEVGRPFEGCHDPVNKDELEMTGQVNALRYLQQCRGGALQPIPVSK